MWKATFTGAKLMILSSIISSETGSRRKNPVHAAETGKEGRMRQKKKNRKGYTLVELIVVFALTAVFMTAAVMMLGAAMRVFHRVQNLSHAQTVADTLMEHMVSELSAAVNAPYDSGVPCLISADASRISFVEKHGIPIQIYIKDGLLQFDYQEVKENEVVISQAVDWYYGEEMYMNNRVERLKFTWKQENQIGKAHV